MRNGRLKVAVSRTNRCTMSVETSPAGEAVSCSDPDDKSPSVECPTCGRDDFGAPGDMKVHHYQAHGESIAEETVECAWCGETKTETAGEVKRRDRFFCDAECKGKWQSREVVGENHPSWDGGKVTVECDWCGDERRMYPSHAAEADHHFCPDTNCSDLWRSENFSGEDSPGWNGGEAKYYGANWRQQRRKAYIRDQGRCQECGATRLDIGRGVHVHHRKRLKWFEDNYDAPEWWERGNRLENLITLCPEHHAKWEKLPVQPHPNTMGNT